MRKLITSFLTSTILILCSPSIKAQVTPLQKEKVLTPQEYFDHLKSSNTHFNEETFFDDFTSDVTLTQMVYEVEALMNKTVSSVSQAAIPPCGDGFFDGFEDGTYLPEWVEYDNNYTRTVTPVNPAEGSFSLQQDGETDHFEGLSRTFAPFQPDSISFWVKPNGPSGSNHNYVVIGDANITTNFGILFFYYESSNGFRFYANISNDIFISASLGVWYKIEIKDIDWTNKEFDIYIDNILIQSDFPFRSNTSTDINQIHLYAVNGINPSSTYDSISIGCATQEVIPTLSQWGTIILMLIFLSFGTVYIRNRNHSYSYVSLQ